jgi:hypothetical protein
MGALSDADATTILRIIEPISMDLGSILGDTIHLTQQLLVTDVGAIGLFGANDALTDTVLMNLKHYISALRGQITVRCDAAKSSGDYSICDRLSRMPSSLVSPSVLVLIDSITC